MVPRFKALILLHRPLCISLSMSWAKHLKTPGSPRSSEALASLKAPSLRSSPAEDGRRGWEVSGLSLIACAEVSKLASQVDRRAAGHRGKAAFAFMPSDALRGPDFLGMSAGAWGFERVL